MWKQTGIYTTVEIGDNPWLAKAALDLYSKHNQNMRAEIRYEDVPTMLWTVKELTELCGIAKRTEKRLNRLGVWNVYDLAHADYWRLKTQLGVVGTELYAKAWGVDRSFLGQKYTSKSKSIGNSQVLHKDYTRRAEVETVIKEMADQVATRLRQSGVKTECVSLWIGFSMGYIDPKYPEKRGFHQQLKIPLTNASKEIAEALLLIFNRHYHYQDIRNIGVNCSKLTFTNTLQLNLFTEPEKQTNNYKIDYVIDTIRKKYGFKAIVHGTSLMPGSRAIERSSLVGGHAGGMSGIESDPHG